MSDESEGSWYKRTPRGREWVLLILFVIVVEALVLTSAYSLPAETDIVRFISFTASITSIILAVLAVVYSYYQNFAQRRDSRLISEQIGELRRVIRQVDESTDNLESEIRRSIQTSSDIHKAVSEWQEESREKLKDVSNTVDSLDEYIMTGNKDIDDDVTSTIELNNGQIEEYFSSMPSLARAYILFVHNFRQELSDISFAQRCTYFAIYFSETDDDYLQGVHAGSFLFTSISLDILNLLDTNTFVLSSKLESLSIRWANGLLDGSVNASETVVNIVKSIRDTDELDPEPEQAFISPN